MAIRQRRSTLFVGALVLDGLQAALESGADLVCIDLEDAVPPDRKDEAREAMVSRLAGLRVPDSVQLLARVNTVGSPEGVADIRAALSKAPAIAALLLPKVERVEEIRTVASMAETARSSAELYAIIETAQGLEDCGAIARAGPRLKALFFGGFDLSKALGCAMAWEPLLYARSRVVHAGALGGIPVLDSPYPDIDDLEGLRANCERIKALGMRGKAAKHAKQIPTIRDAFTPRLAGNE